MPPPPPPPPPPAPSPAVTQLLYASPTSYLLSRLNLSILSPTQSQPSARKSHRKKPDGFRNHGSLHSLCISGACLPVRELRRRHPSCCSCAVLRVCMRRTHRWMHAHHAALASRRPESDEFRGRHSMRGRPLPPLLRHAHLGSGSQRHPHSPSRSCRRRCQLTTRRICG